MNDILNFNQWNFKEYSFIMYAYASKIKKATNFRALNDERYEIDKRRICDEYHQHRQNTGLTVGALKPVEKSAHYASASMLSA